MFCIHLTPGWKRVFVLISLRRDDCHTFRGHKVLFNILAAVSNIVMAVYALKK